MPPVAQALATLDEGVALDGQQLRRALAWLSAFAEAWPSDSEAAAAQGQQLRRDGRVAEPATDGPGPQAGR